MSEILSQQPNSISDNNNTFAHSRIARFGATIAALGLSIGGSAASAASAESTPTTLAYASGTTGVLPTVIETTSAVFDEGLFSFTYSQNVALAEADNDNTHSRIFAFPFPGCEGNRLTQIGFKALSGEKTSQDIVMTAESGGVVSSPVEFYGSKEFTGIRVPASIDASTGMAKVTIVATRGSDGVVSQKEINLPVDCSNEIYNSIIGKNNTNTLPKSTIASVTTVQNTINTTDTKAKVSLPTTKPAPITKPKKTIKKALHSVVTKIKH